MSQSRGKRSGPAKRLGRRRERGGQMNATKKRGKAGSEQRAG